MTKTRLGLDQIFKNSWEVYRKNLGPLILIVLLGSILISVFVIPGIVALMVGLGLGVGKEEITFSTFSLGGIVIFVVALVLAILASIIYSVALIKGVGLAEAGKKINFKEVSLFAFKKFGAAFWAGLFAGAIIMVGFVLLIIPGLVLAVYLQFVLYAVIFEDKTGWQAIQRSFEIIKGNFWWVVLIILIIMILQGLISWVPFVGGIAAFLLTPLWQIITYLLYKDLRKRKAEIMEG